MRIKFLGVGCADAIRITFRGLDNVTHNIFIDGGPERNTTYNVLRHEIEEIISSGETIDMWIITHIDDDHIGGLLKYIQDNELIGKLDLHETIFWYNCHPNRDYTIHTNPTSYLSLHQGIKLRDFLDKNALLREKITAEQPAYHIDDLKITILSPSAKSYAAFIDKWTTGEIPAKKYQNWLSSARNDYKRFINEFDTESFEPDTSVWNRSSIAILIELGDSKILLSGDSCSDILFDQLIKKGYSANNKLHLDLMQLPHHGSKSNTSKQLLEILSCQNYVISADGINRHNLPHKETLARIYALDKFQKNNIYFTHNNTVLSSILKIETSAIQDSLSMQFPTTEPLQFEI